MPPRTPAKKHDEESVASSNKRDGSPVLKKAPVTLQLRSESITFASTDASLTARRAFNSKRKYVVYTRA